MIVVVRSAVIVGLGKDKERRKGTQLPWSCPEKTCSWFVIVDGVKA